MTRATAPHPRSSLSITNWHLSSAVLDTKRRPNARSLAKIHSASWFTMKIMATSAKGKESSRLWKIKYVEGVLPAISTSAEICWVRLLLWKLSTKISLRSYGVTAKVCFPPIKEVIKGQLEKIATFKWEEKRPRINKRQTHSPIKNLTRSLKKKKKKHLLNARLLVSEYKSCFNQLPTKQKVKKNQYTNTCLSFEW